MVLEGFNSLGRKAMQSCLDNQAKMLTPEPLPKPFN